METFEVKIRLPKPGRHWLRFSLRTGLVLLVIFCFVLGYYANRAQLRRKEATVGGKYSILLHTIYVPADKRNYGLFNDFGHWSGTSYAGETNLSPGYWVYVEPNWYIWKERTLPTAKPK